MGDEEEEEGHTEDDCGSASFTNNQHESELFVIVTEDDNDPHCEGAEEAECGDYSHLRHVIFPYIEASWLFVFGFFPIKSVLDLIFGKFLLLRRQRRQSVF